MPVYAKRERSRDPCFLSEVLIHATYYVRKRTRTCVNIAGPSGSRRAINYTDLSKPLFHRVLSPLSHRKLESSTHSTIYCNVSMHVHLCVRYAIAILTWKLVSSAVADGMRIDAATVNSSPHLRPSRTASDERKLLALRHPAAKDKASRVDDVAEERVFKLSETAEIVESMPDDLKVPLLQQYMDTLKANPDQHFAELGFNTHDSRMIGSETLFSWLRDVYITSDKPLTADKILSLLSSGKNTPHKLTTVFHSFPYDLKTLRLKLQLLLLEHLLSSPVPINEAWHQPFVMSKEFVKPNYSENLDQSKLLAFLHFAESQLRNMMKDSSYLETISNLLIGLFPAATSTPTRVLLFQKIAQSEGLQRLGLALQKRFYTYVVENFVTSEKDLRNLVKAHKEKSVKWLMTDEQEIDLEAAIDTYISVRGSILYT